MDGIHNVIIRMLFDFYPEIFNVPYNLCLKCAIFPVTWKTSKIILIPKADEKSRPIALLKTFGKVLDKLITNRMMHHIFKNNPFHHDQFGFVPGRCTDDALFQAVTYIRKHRTEQHV
ncbi:Hypothetical protein in type-1 retrotransposable element R1DM, partial [Stegodyphus mimosarum]